MTNLPDPTRARIEEYAKLSSCEAAFTDGALFGYRLAMEEINKRDAAIAKMKKEMTTAADYLDSLGSLPVEEPEHQMRKSLRKALTEVERILKGEE